MHHARQFLGLFFFRLNMDFNEDPEREKHGRMQTLLFEFRLLGYQWNPRMSDWLRLVGSFLSFISAVLPTQLSALHCAEVGRVCVRVCLYSNLLCQSPTELHPAVATSLLVAAGLFRWPFTSWERAWGSVFNFLLSRLSPDRKLHPKTARGLICRGPLKVTDVWVHIVPGLNGASSKQVPRSDVRTPHVSDLSRLLHFSSSVSYSTFVTLVGAGGTRTCPRPRTSTFTFY